MKKDIYVVVVLARDDKVAFPYLGGLLYHDAEQAEKAAQEATVRTRVPHYIMVAATKVVPPEPVCTFVPLRPKALEIG